MEQTTFRCQHPYECVVIHVYVEETVCVGNVTRARYRHLLVFDRVLVQCVLPICFLHPC